MSTIAREFQEGDELEYADEVTLEYFAKVPFEKSFKNN
jgi:hypothetical protein